jgi:hypothetical protein
LEKEKNRVIKPKVVTEDWKDVTDKEANPEIGVHEYFVAKRAATKMLTKFR